MTEKRIEAIRALAAFGRAGRGREAVEAILDMASGYDFQVINYTSVEGQLQQAVLKLLTARHANHLSDTIWLPLLQERIDPEPSKKNWLAAQLLTNHFTTDQSVMERLVALTRHADPNVRKAAMTALLQSDLELSNPVVLGAFRQALSSEESSTITSALSVLGNRWCYLPEMMPLLFHPDLLVRQHARKGISVSKSNLQPDHAKKVADMLVGVLRDKQRSSDHLAAIRAMSAMLTTEGPNNENLTRLLPTLTEKYVPALEAFALETDRKNDGEMAIALATAMRLSGLSFLEEMKQCLKAIAGGTVHGNSIKKEEAILFPPMNPSDLKGRGMGGGGGGGMF